MNTTLNTPSLPTISELCLNSDSDSDASNTGEVVVEKVMNVQTAKTIDNDDKSTDSGFSLSSFLDKSSNKGLQVSSTSSSKRSDLPIHSLLLHPPHLPLHYQNLG